MKQSDIRQMIKTMVLDEIRSRGIRHKDLDVDQVADQIFNRITIDLRLTVTEALNLPPPERSPGDGFTGKTRHPMLGDVLAPFKTKSLSIDKESIVVHSRDIPGNIGHDFYPGYTTITVRMLADADGTLLSEAPDIKVNVGPPSSISNAVEHVTVVRQRRLRFE